MKLPKFCRRSPSPPGRRRLPPARDAQVSRDSVEGDERETVARGEAEEAEGRGEGEMRTPLYLSFCSISNREQNT